MAGIGFALRKLSEQDTIISQTASAGHAILISSGPWIVIMSGLAVLTHMVTPSLGDIDTKVFSILVIYCFALSLVITSPITLDSSLSVSRLLFEQAFEKVQRVYIGSLVVAAGFAILLGLLVFFVALRLDAPLALSAMICLVQVSLLWQAMALVAAIKQYAIVTLAFGIGLAISVLCGTGAAWLGYGPQGVLLGFATGLCIAFLILNTLIIGTFPGTLPEMGTTLRGLGKARLQSLTFVLSGIVSAFALWADKLVVWNSPIANSVGNGLMYAPYYDSPMFIAFLSVVPVLSVLVVWLETSFFEGYRRYRDTVHSGGTLRQLESLRQKLARETVDAVFTAFVVQLSISTALLLASPLLVRVLGLPFESLSVLRLAFAGAAFHFLFQACCGVILFVQFGRAYLWLQLIFLVLNGGLTALVISNGDLQGLGYVLAAMGSGIVAFAVMRRTLASLNYLTFIVSNPSTKMVKFALRPSGNSR